MREQLHPVYVLHRRPYRETSLLIEAFSQHHGRVGLVARGVRTQRSPWRAVFEPFRPLLIAWRGRGELATVTTAEPDGPELRLRGRAIASGFYLNELMLRLLQRQDPHPALYPHYAHAIGALASEADLEPTLRRFEKAMLDSLGYGLRLDRDAERGAPIAAEARYVYAPEIGPLPDCGDGRAGIAVQGRTLLAIAREEFDAQSGPEAKQLMRYLLQQQLGARPLASRELLRAPRRD